MLDLPGKSNHYVEIFVSKEKKGGEYPLSMLNSIHTVHMLKTKLNTVIFFHFPLKQTCLNPPPFFLPYYSSPLIFPLLNLHSPINTINTYYYINHNSHVFSISNTNSKTHRFIHHLHLHHFLHPYGLNLNLNLTQSIQFRYGVGQ